MYGRKEKLLKKTEAERGMHMTDGKMQTYIFMVFMILVLLLVCGTKSYAGQSDSGTLCIVLDPGHGGEQTGAEAIDGETQEKDINLRLAEALKREMKAYEDVEVYLTRSEDVELSLERRTEIALEYDADYMISLHNNAYGPVAPYDHGCTVLAANGNLAENLAEEEYRLGVNILHELSQIGLENQGLMIRDSEAGETYENGKIADYYGLIRAGILHDLPTIIVEHAFVDHTEDFENYLSTEDKIEELARADARGIARFFQLRQRESGEILPALSDMDERIVHVIDENGSHNINSTWHFDTAISAFYPEDQIVTEAPAPKTRDAGEKGMASGTAAETDTEKKSGTRDPKAAGTAEQEGSPEADENGVFPEGRRILLMAGGVLFFFAALTLLFLFRKRHQKKDFVT